MGPRQTRSLHSRGGKLNDYCFASSRSNFSVEISRAPYISDRVDLCRYQHTHLHGSHIGKTNSEAQTEDSEEAVPFLGG